MCQKAYFKLVSSTKRDLNEYEEVKMQSARVLGVLMGDKLSGTIQEGAGITWFVTMLLPVVE